VVERWVLTDSTELRQLRYALRQTLETQLPIPARELDDVAERMMIVATELATNALRHARCPALIELSRTKKSLVLDVADDQPATPPLPTGEPAPESGGGRGLKIIEALASDTGWYVTGGRKHVWAQFRLPHRRRFQLPRISVSALADVVRRSPRIGS
jgi:hypothetical protein